MSDDKAPKTTIKKAQPRVPRATHPARILTDHTGNDFFKDIVWTIRDPLVVLDKNLRVLLANHSFYQLFKMKQKDTVGVKIYDLGDRQWDIPTLRTLLETILPDKVAFNDYMVEHDFPSIGTRILLLNARRTPAPPKEAQWILLAFEDITERRELERILQASEERFHRAFETANDGMLLVEKTAGKIVNSNLAAEDLLGYSKRSLKTKNLWEIGLLKDAGHFKQTASELEAHGLVAMLDISIPTRRGGDFPADVYLMDRAAVIQCNIREMTGRRQAEEEIKQLAAIVDSSDDAIISKTLDGIIVSWNKGAEKIYGYTAAEAIGQPVSILAPTGQSDEFAQILQKIKQGKNVTHFETVRRVKNGQMISVSLTVSPVKDVSGKIVGASTIARDISDRKLAEVKFQNALVDLKRSNVELEQFAYVASHDLQEPLRMVSSYVQLLERRYRGKLDKDADEFIGFAVDGANRMQHLINDLLTFSRVGTRGKPFASISCDTALDQALENLQAAIQENKAIITRDPLPGVLADEGQMVQLFQNLVGNAIKFHEKKTPRVHISVKENPKEWVFGVRDNGIGIDPQYTERIFIIFQRLNSREMYAGTGIGLAMCKKIVERHGGRIWVESKPGQGATFFFTLPKIGGGLS